MATQTPTQQETLIPTGSWNVDPVHSTVEFSVRNMGIVNVKGHFREFEGTLESNGDLGSVQARGSVRVASVDTRSEKRDEHLLADDFFDAENHSQMTFESTRIEPAGDRLRVIGNLTIRGTTREVELDAVVHGPIEDPWGGERVGIEVTGAINRLDYGLRWDVKTPGGDRLASNEVKLELYVGAVKAE
jgi:polyisoprenoid-binding protein YceI